MAIPFLHRPRNQPTGEESSGAPVADETSPAAGSASPGGSARNEAVLRAMIEAMDAMVAIARPDGSLWLWNRACESGTGLAMRDLTGAPLWDVMQLSANQRPAAQAAMERLIKGQELVVPFQSQGLRKDGRKTRIAWNARLVSWSGQPLLVLATGAEVTRGRKVAQELAESEARYEALLELVPDPIVVHQDGRIVFANNAAAVIYRAESREALLGRSVLDLVAPESTEMVAERMARGVAKGESAPLAHERYLRLDGSTFDAEVVATPVMFDGRVAIEVIAHDITERNATEDALRASEAQMRSLLEAAPAVVFAASADGVVTSIFGQAEKIYRRPSPSPLGKNIFDVASQIPEFVSGARTALGGESTVVRIRRPGISLECRLNPMVGADGSVTGLTGVVIDARESEAAAADRAETEARVRAVFDETSLGMILLDDQGHCLESNAAFQALLGYSQEELRRMSVAEYTHPADHEETARALLEIFGGTMGRHEMEKRYIAKGGREIWVRVHISPVRTADGRPSMSVGTVEDISAHKELEEQLTQASKMEALGRLAGGVAHDFNNLLTVVNGYADLLAQSLDGDERAADAIEIRRAGARATELTAQLLAFGRRSRRALEPVELNAGISAMVPMLRRLLGEDIEFTTHLDPSLGAVEADPSQLEQVVMNLVVNGRDAMPSGGELKISSFRLDDAPAWIDPARSDRAWARLEIADSGFGMGPEIIEHIFEPFFTTKGQGKGTGLGLATVYGIVQQMGGRIHVESTLGIGSTFIVDLPLCGPSVRPKDVGLAARPIQGRGRETILLVEDEPAVREFCRRALVDDGYAVRATGPREALDAATELGANLALLVTDVVMPDFDGPTIAAALGARNRDLRVLFMSGYPLDRESELTGAAADGTILSKPFTPGEICDAVRRVLDRPARVD